MRQRQIPFAAHFEVLQNGLLYRKLERPVSGIRFRQVTVRRVPLLPGEGQKSDIEGSAKYSFSSPGESEQAVGFDCAQTERQRTDQRAMVRMEEPRCDDCSAAEKIERPSADRPRKQVSMKAQPSDAAPTEST